MTEKKAMDIVYSILDKKQGLTEGEIANNWFNPPVRPSEKRGLVTDAIIELIQDGRVFFECEKPSIKTMIYGNSPYRYFTDTARTKHQIVE